MKFREWLLLNENVEANLENWLGDIIKYAKKPEEKLVIDHLSRTREITLDPPSMAQPYRDSTVSVLKEKRLENPNWLAFSLGYLSAKLFRREDLEMAVDVAKRLISSGELPKSEIGARGWLLTGRDIYPKVQEYLAASQRISNRAGKRMRKKGEAQNDDEKLIKLVAAEGNLKLYLVAAMPEEFQSDENETNARHRILCKYGKGTGWCTASPTGGYHKMYVANNIYIVHEDDAPLYQFVDCNDDENRQFMDTDDNEVKEINRRVLAFIATNANVRCYDLQEDGPLFWNLEQYLDSSEGMRDMARADDVTAILGDAARKKEALQAAAALKGRLHLLASKKNYATHISIALDKETKGKLYNMIADDFAEKYKDADPGQWKNKDRNWGAADQIPANSSIISDIVVNAADRRDAARKLAKFMTIYSAGRVLGDYKDAARDIIMNNDRLSAFVFLVNPHAMYEGIEDDLGRKRIDMMNQEQVATLLGGQKIMRSYEDAYENEDGWSTVNHHRRFDDRIARIIGTTGFNKLGAENIRRIIFNAPDDRKKHVVDAIRKYKTNITPEEEEFLARQEEGLKK